MTIDLTSVHVGTELPALPALPVEPISRATLALFAGGERRARLELTVTLADGTVTLRGDAEIALTPDPV